LSKLGFLSLLIFIGCKNPFAPALDDRPNNDGATISDLKNVNGVFQNFQYAYVFKDTTIYGKLIAGDFLFTFRDFEQGIDVSWGRDEEMKTTYGLFQTSQRLDLIWNNEILNTQDSLNATIIRAFNLTITFNATDIVRVNGRVNLSLRKDPILETWAIVRWIDESNF
jgi:hypothetical protein